MKPTQAEIKELTEILKGNIDKMTKSKTLAEVIFLQGICTNQIWDLSDAMQQIIESEEALK